MTEGGYLAVEVEKLKALCDLALRAKAAEQRAGELVEALESWEKYIQYVEKHGFGIAGSEMLRFEETKKALKNYRVLTKSTPALGEGEKLDEN